MSSTPTPVPANGQAAWNGPTGGHFDPSAYQNSYYMGQAGFNPVAYSMQAQAHAHAQQQAHAQATNLAASHPGAGPSGSRSDAGGMDRTSVNQLKDAMSVGGVSLRAEEQFAQRKGAIPSSYSGADRTRKQDFFPESYLADVLRSVAAHHGLRGFKSGVLELTGLAVEQRMRELIEKANAASKHRWDTQTDVLSAVNASRTGENTDDQPRTSLYADGKTPVFDRNLRKDVGKQLLMIEKLEKEEEMRIRRERKEKQEQARQSAARNDTGSGDEDDDGPPKKKKKKAEGPGVQAKNMSEETKKKLSNTVANAAAGFGNRYAWMNAASTPVPRRPAAGGGSTAKASASGWSSSSWGAARGKNTRGKGGRSDKERSLGLRDVLFAVERERGHGGGRGAARGWS